jgi:hypothetical protein
MSTVATIDIFSENICVNKSKIKATIQASLLKNCFKQSRG